MKNTKKSLNIELLSPAGNIEKMRTAFAFGADAVYLGIPDFSLRVRINDFSLDSVKEAVSYAHGINKKVYVTINIFAHNFHLDKLPGHIKQLKKIGVDALIVSDPGIIAIIKKIWPKAIIHLSTQANCTNWQSAKFWHKNGVKRIILGREVTLAEIKEIHKHCPEVELEYFIHGAMCMAYSGRCFLSKELTGRSANLGDCIQPCRWEYFINEVRKPENVFEIVEEPHGSYILNSKDLCLIKYLEKLIDAGVVSVKIEGRAKSVYYQAMVTGIYREAINIVTDKKNTHSQKNKKLNYFYKELDAKLVHRGYTNGFLLGGKGEQNIDSSHKGSDWEFCGQVINNENGIVYLKVHNSIKQGDKVEIISPFYNVTKIKIKGLIDHKTGKKITEAHGGQGTIIGLELQKTVPKMSVVRRLIATA